MAVVDIAGNLDERETKDDDGGRPAAILGLVKHHLERWKHGAGIFQILPIVGNPFVVI